MIPQQLQKMFGLNTTKDLNMANNIWKMLDQMAQSSPQNYKEFISKNINQGFKDIKDKKQQKQKPYKVKPYPGFKMQMDGILSQQILSMGMTNNNIQQVQQKYSSNIQDKLNLSAPKWQQIMSKFQKSIRIHLNICHSERVKLPTLRNTKKQVKEITIQQLKQIQNLYYSLQGPFQENKQNYYFMIVINSHTYQNITRQGGKKILMSLALSYLQQRIKNDRNPLKAKFNILQTGKNAFYKIDGLTVEISSQKTFEWLNKSKDIPEILLEKDIDYKRLQQDKKISEVNKKNNNKKNEYQTQKQILLKKENQIKNQNKKKQQKFQIKFKRQEIPQQDKQTPSLLPKVQQPKKKVIIEVLKETINQNKEQQKQQQKQKQVISSQIPFEMNQTQEGYDFQFLLPNVQSIAQLNLQVCKNVIRLSTKDGKKIQINLLKSINQQKVKAKMKKKVSKLVVNTFFK